LHFKRIDPNDLKPEESPFLTFRCEAGLLRESINSFGKIDASGFPHSVFIQPGNSSTSLPKHVEEYEDADHHVLYKTVEEVQQAMATSSQVNHVERGEGVGRKSSRLKPPAHR
jgi:hypothetical protein